MGRQTPIDKVIKKLSKKLGEAPLLCTQDHRIQITEEDNGHLFIAVEHLIMAEITWLGLYSEELDMDFDIQINRANGHILKDKKIKAVNEMVKFTGEETFVDTLHEKIMETHEALLKQG